MKKAFITGITGQDGSYLAELLINKGYEVHGMLRRASLFNTSRIDHIQKDIKLHYGDVTDSANVNHLISLLKPDEIYNLAAQSHVKVSFEVPEYTAQVDAVGTLRMLDAMRIHCPNSKFYQASTSELYGKVQEVPQSETTPFYPRSPYGVAKIYGFWIVKNFREAYNLYACNGILFNHESERRGESFVTRKITIGIAKMICGISNNIQLGNLDAKRDWGHAKDYVDAMWRMLQQPVAEDFVIATGITTSIRNFIKIAFAEIDVELQFEGVLENEVGIVTKIGKRSGKIKIGQKAILINPLYFRPTEVDLLIGDATKAKQKLGWQATYTLNQIIAEMVAADVKTYKKITRL